MRSVTAPLSPQARAEALQGLRHEELDVLVLGAGVTGAGCALDAVTRGLRVGLVEARDFAAGTSSRSTKLFHGGLRYLEQFDFSLVFEALKERALALDKLAPHLAKPVRFLYPLRRPAVDRGYAGLGIGVYDVMGRDEECRITCVISAVARPLKSSPPPAGTRSAARSASTRVRSTTRGIPCCCLERRRAMARCVRAAPGRSASSTMVSASRVCESVISSPAMSSTSGPGRRSMPPASGSTNCRRCSVGAVSFASAHPRASTSSCPGAGSTPPPA